MNARAEAEWAARPERSNAFALRLMSWIAVNLGRPAARLLLVPISLYFTLFAGRARRASRAYLARTLGRPPRLGEIYAHFHHFAATVLDRVYLLRERFELFDIEVEGAELLQKTMEGGRGALLVGAHLGSFEVLRAAGRYYAELPVAMLMYEENAHKINAALRAINPAAVRDIIPLGQLDSMLRVRERLHTGTLVGMLADRTPGDEPMLEQAFLGAPARFPLGPWRMAALQGGPVLFMAGLHLGGSRYRIVFEELADFTGVGRDRRQAAMEAAAARYAETLARHCRLTPRNWFNFFDFWQEEKRP